MARLRVVHSSASPEDKIIEANALVSKGTPSALSKALRLYTEVLYKDSPGHVCALLNRSLAYLGLGYPELAVADAYRAAQICYDVRRVHSIANVHRKNEDTKIKHDTVWHFEEPWLGSEEAPLANIVRAVKKYLRLEQVHYSSQQEWTTNPMCYIRDPSLQWLQEDFASLVMGDWGLLSGHRARPMFETLEYRAVYRIVGYLWHCRGGAAMDALGLASDILHTVNRCKHFMLYEEEQDYFRNLADIILAECVGEEDEVTQEINKKLRTKTAMVNRVIYPWNTHHPVMDNYGTRKTIEMICDNAAPKCTIRYQEATEDRPFALWLVAAQKIAAGEVVLKELSVLQAVTPCDEQTFCELCSARLVRHKSADAEHDDSSEGSTEALDPSFMDAMRTEPTQSRSPGPSSQSEAEPPYQAPSPVYPTVSGHRRRVSWSEQLQAIAEHADRRVSRQTLSPDIRDSIETSSDQTSCDDGAVPPTPVLSEGSSSSVSTDILSHVLDRTRRHDRSRAPSFSQSQKSPSVEHTINSCTDCGEAIFCSSDCAALSGETHVTMCDKTIGEVLKDRLDVACRTMTDGAMPYGNHPNASYLHLRLLLKVIGLAESRKTHPLDLAETQLLNGGLYRAPALKAFGNGPCGKVEENDQDYAMHSEAKALPWSFDNNVVLPMRLLKQMGIDAWNDLDKYDAWVLNTIFAKMDHSMSITKGFKQVKEYNSEGIMVSESAGGDRCMDDQVWIGTVHPVFSLIQVADPADKRQANISVSNVSEIVCNAISAKGPCSALDQTRMEVDSGMEDDDHEVTGSVCIEAEVPIIRPDYSSQSEAPSNGKNMNSFSSCASDIRTMNLAIRSTTSSSSSMDLD